MLERTPGGPVLNDAKGRFLNLNQMSHVDHELMINTPVGLVPVGGQDRLGCDVLAELKCVGGQDVT